VRTDWDPDKLVGSWTLVGQDWELIANKTGPTRLGFALLLKFLELEARFPGGPEHISQAAVSYVAGQVSVAVEDFERYPWAGRSIKGHRAQIRQAFGFREWTVADEAEVADWLAVEVCPAELVPERVAHALYVRCRSMRIEPPAATRLERVVGAARTQFEAESVSGRVPGLGPRERRGWACSSPRRPPAGAPCTS
jgi:Domain of unknown function (DUF4158)